MDPPFAERLLNAQGLYCPTCGKWAQIYRRKLNSTASAALVRLYRLTRPHLPTPTPEDIPYFHASEFALPLAADYSKPRYWDLMQAHPEPPPDKRKRTSGLWRITLKGIEFVKGELSVPSHVFEYNGTVLLFDGAQIDIHEALGAHFNYAALMGGYDDDD